ncbi:MAG: sigma-70 family RNA polymerase sigma factor, partial [Myxococcales bacterium]|nr:sigma-70 family RNA polymerase sigma factor [Myxococcales bacterium]
MAAAGWTGDRLERVRAVYGRTCGQVRCIVRHLGVPKVAVEAITREVYVEVMRRGESLQNMGATRSLLSRVARKIAARERSLPGARASDGIPPLDPNAPEDQILIEAARVLEGFLAAFNMESRDIFILGTIGSVPPERIASELGLPRRRVKQELDELREQFAAVAASSSLGGPKELLKACVDGEQPEPAVIDASLPELLKAVGVPSSALASLSGAPVPSARPLLPAPPTLGGPSSRPGQSSFVPAPPVVGPPTSRSRGSSFVPAPPKVGPETSRGGGSSFVPAPPKLGKSKTQIGSSSFSSRVGLSPPPEAPPAVSPPTVTPPTVTPPSVSSSPVVPVVPSVPSVPHLPSVTPPSLSVPPVPSVTPPSVSPASSLKPPGLGAVGPSVAASPSASPSSSARPSSARTRGKTILTQGPPLTPGVATPSLAPLTSASTAPGRTVLTEGPPSSSSTPSMSSRAGRTVLTEGPPAAAP